MRYKTKPNEIEAHRWDGDWEELKAWAGRVSDGNGTSLYYHQRADNRDVLLVYTLEGVMEATLGDYVICGLEGEFYFCKPEIFHKKYEVA